MIKYITVISDCKHGNTYEVKYTNSLTTSVYTDNTVPAYVKNLVNIPNSTITDDRTTYTIREYYFEPIKRSI